MPKVQEKLTPEYLDFLYRNTGGKMGKPLQTIPIPENQSPPQQLPPNEQKKYEAPSNGWRRALYAFGGGNPADIDQMQIAQQEREALDDPNSMRSKVARLLSSRIGGPTDENLAARDINDYLPSFEKLAMLKAKQGVGGPKEPKLTQDERNVAGFAQRIRSASDILKSIDAKTAAPSFIESRFGIEAPEYFKSPERQKADQATRDFVNAQLRRESGAAISPPEFENARMQYFPQPGDSKAVLDQKEIARENAFKNMKFSSGKGYDILQQEYGQQVPEIQNISQGAGDITKEKWLEPTGSQIEISPTDPNYERTISILKRKGAKRL